MVWTTAVARRAFALVFGHRFPYTAGRLVVPGVERAVAIRRDRWGVPYIDAQTESDAWYALGFCHGQDRAFQLEASLRVVRGTLSELVGADGLPVDRLSRRIGFARSAAEQVLLLDPGILSSISAYARGVTDGATLGVRKPAHEFAILRAEPTAWTAADVLGYGKLTSFILSTNWDVELARLKILEGDGIEALEALDPAYPEWQPVISPPGDVAGSATENLASDVASLAAIVPLGGGSNNWALGPERTASGRPLLANDPHLAASLPPHWYLAHLRTPQWTAVGATFLGLPAVPVGHNGVAAWGVTVGMTDNTDLFVEEMGPDGVSVRQGDEYVACDVREERIGIRGQPDVIERVLVTARGPIIGPALDGDVGAVSLRAVWLDPLPVSGLLDVHHTQNFEDFHRRLADWPGVPLNVVYADTSEAIGWQLIGTAPRRWSGRGAVPLPGWDADAGWEEDMLPYDDLPYLSNPDSGLVVTANNRTAAAGTGPMLTVDWIDGYRAARIFEVLEERHDWDIERSTLLQTDVMSLPWQEMRAGVLATPAQNNAAQRALDLLTEWDGQVSAASVGATVFELFVAEMSERVARARAPHGYTWALGQGFHAMSPHNTFSARRVGHLSALVRQKPEGWFGHSWEEEMSEALSAVIRRLRTDYGRNEARWAWGTIRPLRLTHPFGMRKPFDRIYNLGPFPWGGDSNTVAQAAVAPLDPTSNPGFIASLRMTIDVGNWDDARFILPGGQSGNPLSPHYADQLPLWLRGESITIPFSPETAAEVARETLELVPPAVITKEQTP